MLFSTLFYFTFYYVILVFLKFRERPKTNNVIIYCLSRCVFFNFFDSEDYNYVNIKF